ncbi:MAG: N-acetylmuramoyl-L-alanine amidase [Clostridium sp.]|nr:N-acetylmuramoyl-L-alanine amidase [Acetatifactor muris]MCM1527461.1 N-acetylmuramoyl-L-alanine amidase [Bacteroides sp.]MCM1562093.1 N-acetylmuramoyl-L-alanine amidase [Clostridium sp.]
MGFIEQIVPYIQKYAPQYGISICSPIVAQAILESASGTSELARNAHNYFGLKYRAGRCPTACGIYRKIGSEQNADGSYLSSSMNWMRFPDMESGVRGYFDFTNISNYANLKGVTDPQIYLENIKQDGYATSIRYVDNVMAVVRKYDLTQYDTWDKPRQSTKGERQMIINIHAGHNPDGKIACGAVGLIKESTEARIVKDKVIDRLRTQGHTVYDCTVNDGTSQNNVLSRIVQKCNARPADLDISIHFNSGAKDKGGNGRTTGTEIYVYSSTSKAKPYAQRIVNAIAALGFKNRGVKVSPSLYVLKKTKSPALLIECCFVDDRDDVALYRADQMADAIVKGITGRI